MRIFKTLILELGYQNFPEVFVSAKAIIIQTSKQKISKQKQTHTQTQKVNFMI